MNNSTLRFSKSVLDRLVQKKQQVIIKDTEIKGFRFKVGKLGSQYFFQKRINGTTKGSAYITIGNYGEISLEVARKEALRLANLCERGIDPRKESTDPENTTTVLLGTMLTMFWKLKQGLKKSTLEKYKRILNFIPPHWHSMAWEKITPDLLVEQLYIIKEKSSTQGWTFLSVVQNVYRSCAPFFKDDQGKRLLNSNPIPLAHKMIDAVRPGRRKRSVASVSQLGKLVVFLEAVRNGTAYPSKEEYRWKRIIQASELVLMALFTGFRRCELCCLKWDYVNFEQGYIHLPGREQEQGGPFKGTKNRFDHNLPLTSYPLSLLCDIARKRGKKGTLVFPSIYDKDRKFSYPHLFTELISKEIGSHFSLHSARRTFASIADDIDIGFLSIKRILNHHFEGGVTGGYIIKGFNPEKDHNDCQKICDYILERRAEYLGSISGKRGNDLKEAFQKIQETLSKLNLNPKTALMLLDKADTCRD